MDLLSSFRNADLTKVVIDRIHKATKSSWKIMEICGGQTHAIMQYGIDQLLPSKIEMIHGPGCPVCVTSLELIEQAIHIANLPGVIFTSFGDMLRVPGVSQDLLSVRASGADVRVVYSPFDAVKIAQTNPKKQVVFLGVGFETTVPAIGMSILHAFREAINNFSIIPANVLVPPAMHTILGSSDTLINGFLAAGHVCAVMGYWQYEPIAEKYHCPIVVTGFDPLDLVNGIYKTILQLEQGKYYVENAYTRAVRKEGNLKAQAIMNEVFEPVDRQWRGIGIIPKSGLTLQKKFASFNAIMRFPLHLNPVSESSLCIAGKVLQGLAKPIDCPAFCKECTPTTPLGAPMVSSEGTCAAYYRYQRLGTND